MLSTPSGVQKPLIRPLVVAIVGFGTVGRSVARILVDQPAGPLRLAQIFNRDVQRKRVDWVPSDVRWTENIDEVLTSDVDVVVELIGGLDPAGIWLRRALRAGKSIVTANKQLIEHEGTELIELARQTGCQIAFEAAVGGGIPVVCGLQDGLAGDRLFKIAGILNGTCNYILTRMESAGLAFSDALTEAQSLGYAEADPTYDLEGFDARAKLAILARIGLGRLVTPASIPTATIATIQSVDLAYAHRLDYTIRQISRAELDPREGGRLLAAVQPALVPRSSPWAGIQGPQNLVIATGQFGGETLFAGYGSGGDPAAVAVVSDLIAIAQGKRNPSRWPHTPPTVPTPVSDDFSSAYYIRFIVKDHPGIIASLATVLSRHDLNIDAVLQEPGAPKSALPFVMTLEPCSASRLRPALAEMAKLDFHRQLPVSLPILEHGPR